VVREIRHRELLRMLSSGAQVVDALPSHEYQTTHIRSAIHIPVGQILRDAPKLLERARPIVVYCRDSL
jgi:rhodanese-related sulfurtransferase